MGSVTPPGVTAADPGPTAEEKPVPSSVSPPPAAVPDRLVRHLAAVARLTCERLPARERLEAAIGPELTARLLGSRLASTGRARP